MPFPAAHEYSKAYGDEIATEIAEFGRQHVFAMKELVEREGIECDFWLQRSLDVFCDEEQGEELVEGWERTRKRQESFYRDAGCMRGERVEKVSPTIFKSSPLLLFHVSGQFGLMYI